MAPAERNLPMTEEIARRSQQRSFEGRRDTILSKISDLAQLTGAEVFLEMKFGNTITRVGSPCRQVPGMIEQNLSIDDLQVFTRTTTHPPSWSYSSSAATLEVGSQESSIGRTFRPFLRPSSFASGKPVSSVVASLCCRVKTEPCSRSPSPEDRNNGGEHETERWQDKYAEPSLPIHIRTLERGGHLYKYVKSRKPKVNRPPSPHPSALKERRSRLRDC